MTWIAGHSAKNAANPQNARKGAVKKRTPAQGQLGGAAAWTERNKKSGEFKAVK